ncbi:MAG: hypothetical protein K6L81_16190 [Agarilytica sp.]
MRHKVEGLGTLVSEQEQLEAELASAFTDEFVLPSYPKAYHIRLWAVVAALTLPVFAYCLVILFFFYYAVVALINFFPFSEGGMSSFSLFMYLVLLFVLASLMLGLLRPFFSGRGGGQFIALDPQSQSNIYVFSNFLADKLNVDPIKEIAIGNSVVIAAGYKDIFAFKNRRVSLEIGLPLIPTLSASEFCSLLVHELARYSYGKSRVANFAIRMLYEWFYRIANGEDVWFCRAQDIASSNKLYSAASFTFLLATKAVNALFEVFLNLADLIARNSIAESEYNADAIASNILGSDEFDHLLKHLVQIDQAFHFAVEESLSGDSVPENIADLILSIYEKNPIQTDQFIEMVPADNFNSWYFLPPPNARTRRVKKLKVSAKFSSSRSLENLFVDPDLLGKALSSLLYDQSGVEATKHAVKSEVDERKSSILLPKEEAILKRFSSGLFRRDIVWEFPQADKFSSLPEENIVPFLNKLVLTIRHNLPDLTKYMELLGDYEKQVIRLHFAQWLIKDGSKKRPDADEIDELKFNVKEFDRKFSGKKAQYRKSYGVRVSAAVALGKESKAYGSATKLIKMLSALSALQDSISESKTKSSTLEKLIARRAEGDDFHQKTISRLTRMVLKVVEDMEKVLVRIPEALLQDRIDIHVGRLDLDTLNGEDYEREVADRFFELVRYYDAYNIAISAKLAQFVEMVEGKQDIESVVVANLHREP